MGMGGMGGGMGGMGGGMGGMGGGMGGMGGMGVGSMAGARSATIEDRAVLLAKATDRASGGIHKIRTATADPGAASAAGAGLRPAARRRSTWLNVLRN